jgi:ribosomal subunit interface protein
MRYGDRNSDRFHGSSIILALQDLLDDSQKPRRRNVSVAVGCWAMNTTRPSLIVSTEGFANRAHLTWYTEEKMAKLLRHAHPYVGLVRVHVKRETPHSHPPYFAVRAIVQTAGPDHLAHAEATEPATAINAAFDKLERRVTAAARERKRRQRHAAPVGPGVECAEI